MKPALVVVFLVCLVVPLAADEFTIEAKDFDDGSVRVSLPGQPYADAHSCIWHGGISPDRAEYVIEFPVTADYTLFALYAAQQSRPVEIGVDGKVAHKGFGGVTGSWQTKSAMWEKQCLLRIERGTHSIVLQREGAFPHICALRLQSPDGAKLKRLSPKQRAERARLNALRARVQAQVAVLERANPESVRLAVEDLARTFPGRYDAATYQKALAAFETQRVGMLKSLAEGKPAEPAVIEKLLAGVRAALLANPLLDFDRLLVVRRTPANSTGFVPHNYLTHAAIPRSGFDNEIAVLSDLRSQPKLVRLFKPAGDRILRDVHLDFDGERMLFSSVDDNKRWAVFQVRSDGSGVEQLTPKTFPDLDFFDACYLPNGKIIVCSTANYIGLPCLSGNQQITSLYLLDPATKVLRQLTFDQDSDNDAVVLNDGRVSYQRWEYSDIPHYFSRRRMSMNPDGTGQLALYGSNSWFPTAFRFAKPVPDHPSRLVGIISGHHDHGDCGRMALMDPALAGAYPFRHRPASKEWGEEGKPIAVTPEILPAEQTGFLQLIPGRGKPVAGTVCDAIINHHYLKELPSLTTHPHPLSSKYFLVSMKPTPQSLWGIYLVDVFDNATLIAEFDGVALFEPQPLVARARPPVIPDRIVPESKTAEVHIADIYSGPGLKGVPRGTVKSLRVFAYHFGYLNKAGFDLIGINSGWDVKRVLGTARVEADGSACFQIPANTPVSLQPLDDEGRAVQLMRSWLVGMPGERVSCVGCHERRMETLPLQRSLADARKSEPLQPWLGPARPFAFAHEVFPVLERYCVGCHDKPATVGPRSKPCFKTPDSAYDTLHPYVRRAGVEGDMDLLTPMEYHASTSLLLQMLEKGHHGVTLAGMSREERERLYCWIDLNVPRIGSWGPPKLAELGTPNRTAKPVKGNAPAKPSCECDQGRRRLELSKLFANNDTDTEAEFKAAEEVFQKRVPVKFVPPPAEPVKADGLKAAGVATAASEAPRVVELGNGVKMTFVQIPAGEFVMGGLDGAPDERPRAVVRVKEPFCMAVTEVTNGQFARFDPEHDTRYVDMHYMDHTVPGHIANHPDQPVARVSWQQAMRFCQWLSLKTGQRVTLPTEAQWEWAARAGADTQFFYGTLDSDFSRFANLADQSLRWYRMKFDGASALPKRYEYPPEMNFPLHDERFRDKWHVVDYVGQTEPNAWGLRDMIGNVSEWTRSSYRPYPYRDDDGRNGESLADRKVARGGSWADRPADAGSSVRRAYESWQKVHDVGFRVIINPSPAANIPPVAQTGINK
ncbi:MAG: SUMF1/EgtB/PvdO family nonheme iron enzyme [Verrucomicrobia bacterium]|nr:SUMF1/EgtB/PvdO family nonheme iron enzyme [Verrucomicrobiota bacterium]